jgi:predicted enzyme related to lactoylglutathione lyase
MTGFIWFDVTAQDTGEVADFYAKLFDWTVAPDTGPSKYAAWIMDGERPWAGVTPAGNLPAGRWVPYVQVDDVDAASAKATSLGATIVQDKTDGPAGTAVVIADPAGAHLALFVPFPS